MIFGIAAVPADDRDKPFSDAEFVNRATSCSLHQFELGKIAQQNAANPEVKKFGERMVNAHTKVNKELKEVADKANLAVPSRMSEDEQKEVDRLKKLTGAEFDKAYIHHMIKDHEKAVEWLTRASKEAKDPGLKDFATRALPTVKEHLDQAKKINKDIGGE
jgi:putative membrane protein